MKTWHEMLVGEDQNVVKRDDVMQAEEGNGQRLLFSEGEASLLQNAWLSRSASLPSSCTFETYVSCSGYSLLCEKRFTRWVSLMV